MPERAAPPFRAAGVRGPGGAGRTRCGFASTIEGSVLTRDEQRDRLSLVVEAAAEIRGAQPLAVVAAPAARHLRRNVP
jgi:hypothetical protein